MQIPESMFRDCQGIINIDIPETVTYIGKYAFNGCANLIRITIPKDVTEIGDAAFSGCNKLYEVNNNSSLTLTFGGYDNGYVSCCAKAITENGEQRTVDGTIFELITTSDDFVFAYFQGQYQLLGYCGSAETVTLPTSINGYEYTINCGIGGVNSIVIPHGKTAIDSDEFRGSKNLKRIVLPDSVEQIATYAFADCPNLEMIVIPDSVTVIEECAFGDVLWSYGQAGFYRNPDNWENGCLYVGNHLIAVDPSVKSLVVKEGTIAIAEDAFKGCYSLKSVTIGGNHYGVLSYLTNLESLVLTALPTEHWIYGYLAWDPSDIPLTLKTIVLKDGCNVTDSWLFYGIAGVTIYVETEKINTQWDHDFVSWNNGNRVYYGGEWIKAEFCDANGNILSSEYYTTSQVIRQPILENIADGEYLKVFVGWDLDGDGVADVVPATSAVDIHATAVFKTHRPGEWTEQVPTCTEDGYRQQLCLDCGEVLSYKHLPKLGHTSAGLVQTVAPTCTEEGYEIHTCATCGEQYHTLFVSATGHSFGEWIEEVEAACTETGLRYHICATCTYREDEMIPAIGHSYTAEVTKTATCTKQGEITYTCEHCGDVVTEATATLPHNYEKVYANKTFLQWLIEHLLNIFFGYEGENGYYFQCTDCRHIQTYEEAMTFSSSTASSTCQHQLGDWTVALNPSCMDVGVEMHYCVLCGEGVEARAYGEPIGSHDFTVDQHDATHHWTKCSRCDEIAGKEVHTGGTATCTEQKVCEDCGVAYGETAEHTVGQWKVEKEPQIGVPGKENLHCRDCNVILDSREIPALIVETTEDLQNHPTTDSEKPAKKGCKSVISANAWSLLLIIPVGLMLRKKKEQD